VPDGRLQVERPRSCADVRAPTPRDAWGEGGSATSLTHARDPAAVIGCVRHGTLSPMGPERPHPCRATPTSPQRKPLKGANTRVAPFARRIGRIGAVTFSFLVVRSERLRLGYRRRSQNQACEQARGSGQSALLLLLDGLRDLDDLARAVRRAGRRA
jgi:hypothetical protein